MEESDPSPVMKKDNTNQNTAIPVIQIDDENDDAIQVCVLDLAVSSVLYSSLPIVCCSGLSTWPWKSVRL